MSKIEFDKNGRSFIEIKRRDGKVVITLSAENADNYKITTVNSVELTMDQFLELIEDFTE